MLHLEDGQSAVIVHGVAAVHVPDDDGAERLAATAKAKYGYGQPASTYREGVWRLAPVKVWPGTSCPRRDPVPLHRTRDAAPDLTVTDTG